VVPAGAGPSSRPESTPDSVSELGLLPLKTLTAAPRAVTCCDPLRVTGSE